MDLYFQQLELARNTTGEERVARHDDVTSGNMAGLNTSYIFPDTY